MQYYNRIPLQRINIEGAITMQAVYCIFHLNQLEDDMFRAQLV